MLILVSIASSPNITNRNVLLENIFAELNLKFSAIKNIHENNRGEKRVKKTITQKI
jgi:hypothetical protein